MKAMIVMISMLLFVLVLFEAKANPMPNVVILYADDMGVADISYGDKNAKIQTPNIDRLAKQRSFLFSRLLTERSLWL